MVTIDYRFVVIEKWLSMLLLFLLDIYVYCKTWGRNVTVCVQRHPNFSRGILLGATQYLTFSKQIITRIANTALYKYPEKSSLNVNHALSTCLCQEVGGYHSEWQYGELLTHSVRFRAARATRNEIRQKCIFGHIWHIWVRI